MKTRLEQMKELVNQLNIYRNAYYNDQTSIISDKEYDELFDKLSKLEEDTGIILSNSPTTTVGYKVKSKLEKVIHSHPMLSLAKTKSENDLIKFAGDKDCILSCKMDGLTVLLSYENGQLVQAETRGDGTQGEIITDNAKTFDNIPLTIPYTGHFEVEGEAIVDYKTFETINNALPDGVEKYKTPRNLASGSVRQLDSSICKNRHIKFIAWKVPTKCSVDPNSFWERLLFAHTLGFEIVPYNTYVNIADKEQLSDIISHLKNVAKDKGYPIDGMVLTYNNIAYGESLGVTSHHPRSGIAFKFYDDEFETELIDIEYTMGKTGILTPIAVFEPVEIDGTMVERASLSNLSVKADTLGVPYRGEPIWVTKRNLIIPKVERATKKDLMDITNEEAILLPMCCPICGKQTEIVKNNDSEILICTNPDCKGKLLGKLVHFCSKEGVNIDGLSESTLKKFIDLGWINQFEDIYRLDIYVHEMEKLEGFGEKSVLKLMDSIEQSTTITLDKFICALSIPLIGRTASKTIAKYFNYDWVKFMNSCEIGSDFSMLDNFGQIMCENMDNYLDHHFDNMCILAEHFDFIKPESELQTLFGKTFVITGSVNKFANRDELKSKIESLGGKVTGSVTKKTNYLINNDINSTSSKNKKAKEFNIPIITEEDFINMIKK